MPFYQCISLAGSLSQEQKEEIVREVTRIHCQETGGLPLFVQIQFDEIASVFLLLVFFPVILSPTNPQSYNPETYLFSSLMAIAAVILLFVLLRTVLPTSDALRRRWYLTSARAEMRDVMAGGRSRRLDDEALFRDADRIGQLVALEPAADDAGRDDLRQALKILGRGASVRRGWAT